MQITISTVLLLLAIICFALAAAGVPSRINLEALGLALLTIAIAVTGWK